MTLLERAPHGRAGRMWLRRRLATAERGCDQLDRKLRILTQELQRLSARADLGRDEWVAACADAEVWMLRASLLGGQDAIRSAIAPQPARTEVTWTTSLGLRYPVDARLVDVPREMPPTTGNAAIGPATAAFAAALLAGVRAAAADEAVRRVGREIAVTRRRLRALEKRWLPQLLEAIRLLELSLEQAEQEDGLRLRRAAARPPA